MFIFSYKYQNIIVEVNFQLELKVHIKVLEKINGLILSVIICKHK